MYFQQKVGDKEDLDLLPRPGVVPHLQCDLLGGWGEGQR